MAWHQSSECLSVRTAWAHNSRMAGHIIFKSGGNILHCTQMTSPERWSRSQGHTNLLNFRMFVSLSVSLHLSPDMQWTLSEIKCMYACMYICNDVALSTSYAYVTLLVSQHSSSSCVRCSSTAVYCSSHIATDLLVYCLYVMCSSSCLLQFLS